MQRQLGEIEKKLETAGAFERLDLLQTRRDLQAELATKGETVDLTSLEDEFVGAASAYGQRKGISYATWREAGVDPAVLRKAGIRRGAGD